jgi:hypothetical protein
VRAGQFLLSPQLDLAAGWTSNVFAVSGSGVPTLERFEDESAFFGIVRPSVAGVSDWNRHEVSFGAYAELFANERFDSETIVNYGANVGGVLDATRDLSLFGGLAYDALNENRQVTNTFILSEEPVEYEAWRAYAGARGERGRWRYTGRLDYAEFDFEDVDIIPVPLPAGFDGDQLDQNDDGLLDQGTGDQDFRDRTETRITLEPGYAITRDASVFLRFAYNWQDFDQVSFLVDPQGRDRDSEGWSVKAGADFDVTNLVRGTVAIGYFQQDFQSDGFGDVSGVGIDAGLEWFPTELTTVSVLAERDAEQSAFVGVGGVVSTDLVARVDHELRRNVVLNAFAGYGIDDFEDTEQEIDYWQAGLGGRYYLNDNVSVGADYTYSSQDVELTFADQGGFDSDYDVHQVLFSVRLTP